MGRARGVLSFGFLVWGSFDPYSYLTDSAERPPIFFHVSETKCP